MSLFITDPEKRGGNNKAALKQALRGEDPEKLRSVAESFKKSPQFAQSELDDALMQCAKQNKAEFVKVLIDVGADPNCGEFKTPLQFAIMLGKEEACEALINSGADIDWGDPPPITMAASLGRLNTVKLMIEHGVDVTAEDSDHRTALDLAKNYNRTEIVDLLHKAGGTQNVRAVLGHHYIRPKKTNDE